jgi:hypothetical protein
MSDVKLMFVLSILPLAAMAVGGGLILLALDRGYEAERLDDDGGWGGGQRRPSRRPHGGPPLPDAVPARVRLREPARIADLLPRPPRRAPSEPVRPTPTPIRRAETRQADHSVLLTSFRPPWSPRRR